MRLLGRSATAPGAEKACLWRNIGTDTAVADVASPSLQNTQKRQQKNADYNGCVYPALFLDWFFQRVKFNSSDGKEISICALDSNKFLKRHRGP